MDPTDFAKAVRLGLGRPAVYLRDHDAAPYRDVLLHACLHNFAIDLDFEANRGRYLYHLIMLTGEATFYRDRILAALAASEEDDAAVQLFDLAKHFALAGDGDARRVMYDRFHANCAAGLLVGGRAIIELDQAEGLIAAADAIGDYPRDPENAWYDEGLLRIAEQAGVADPVAVLERASLTRPRIRGFLDKVAAQRAHEAAKDKTYPDPATVTYAAVKAKLSGDAAEPLGLSMIGFGKAASDVDLLAAAQDLLTETDPKRLRGYLRIFQRRRFPLEPARLIDLALHDDEVVALNAIRALANFAHPNVRDLALRLLATPNERAARAVSLLVQNFAPGDHARVEALALALRDDEAIHSLGIEINDFYDAHPEPDSEERLLRHLYENTPCSLCRGRVVLRLARLNRLPAWMEEEVRHDADAGMHAELEKYRLELANQEATS